jgi:hypothetical protein
MKPKLHALTIALLCAAGASAAEQIVTTESNVVIADAGSGTHRAFAFAGAPEMFGNADWTRFMSMRWATAARSSRTRRTRPRP